MQPNMLSDKTVCLPALLEPPNMLPGEIGCPPALLEPNMLTCDGRWHRVVQLDVAQHVVGQCGLSVSFIGAQHVDM